MYIHIYLYLYLYLYIHIYRFRRHRLTCSGISFFGPLQRVSGVALGGILLLDALREHPGGLVREDVERMSPETRVHKKRAFKTKETRVKTKINAPSKQNKRAFIKNIISARSNKKINARSNKKCAFTNEINARSNKNARSPKKTRVHNTK